MGSSFEKVEPNNVLLAENDESSLLRETLGCGVVDSGCITTVCGEIWYNSYIETLSENDQRRIISKPSEHQFRFGVGKIFKSKKEVTLPMYIDDTQIRMKTQVVEAKIPLLISRNSLKKANASLNFEKDTLDLLGKQISLQITTSGHYCIPLRKGLSKKGSEDIFFTSPLMNLKPEEILPTVKSLHKKFIHPPADKLKKLIKESGIDDKDILSAVDKISKDCETCKIFKATPPRPSVSFPLASVFNEVVALDLKFVDQEIILHMIDHATRFSQACVITNKKKQTIVQALLDNWIAIFGPPGKYLTDNGGEFVNDEMVQLAEKFNITLMTTAAESPWSNGLCERHNAVLAELIIKGKREYNISTKTALPWAVSVKNTLTNVYGFSPNQLVFGRNPNLPDTMIDRPPAGNDCVSYLKEVLTSLHSARQGFVQQQSSERLRRALARKTRKIDQYINGDLVYYKRNNSNEWHGPAKVLGRDAQNYLLKNGGIYIRVHPCRMQIADTHHENSATNECMNEPNANEPSEHNTKANTHVENEKFYQSDSDTEESNVQNVEQEEAHQCTENEVVRNDQIQQNTDHKPSKIPMALRRLANYNKPPIPVSTDDVLITLNDSKLEEAKQEEINKWKQLNVFQEVEDEGQNPRVSTKWVCTEKSKGNETVVKARLVARGFEETNPQIRKDSPTCSKLSLRLLLLIISTHKWHAHTLDVKSAYLQGATIDRELYLIPPKAFGKNKLWRLLKCPYGLVDASRQWYISVLRNLKALSGKQLSLDPGVFIWRSDSCLMGIVAFHVDDFLIGGNETFHATVINRLKEMMTMGNEESSSMTFLGLHIYEDNFAIYLHTNPYSNSLEEVVLSATDKQNTTRQLNLEEKAKLKHVSGQLNWIATQSRPDLAFENCTVGNSSTNANVKTIITTNKAIRKAKSNDVFLCFPKSLNIKEAKIICFCDASFANLDGGSSQGGHLIFIIDNKGTYCLVNWQSHKLKRVVTSTLSAECLAAVEAIDHCIHIRVCLTEILGIKTEAMGIHVITDNKSLHEAAHTTTSVKNRRLQIELSALRDVITKGEITEFRWVNGTHQVANLLTKNGASSDKLLDILKNRRMIFDGRTCQFKEI